MPQYSLWIIIAFVVIGTVGGAIVGGFSKTANKVFTGLNTSYMHYLSSEATYLAVFDYDTDIQLDIHKVFSGLGQVAPEEYAINKKLHAGSIMGAAKRTREQREEKPWWQNNIVGFFFLCGAFVLAVYFWSHISPTFVQATLKFVGGPNGGSYVGTVNNATTGGSSNVGGLVNNILGAGSGIANAVTKIP